MCIRDSIVEDGSFRLRYRMSYRDFKDLYTMLRKRLEKHDGSGVGRNGSVAEEWTLAGTLRYLAGGSIYEVMDGANPSQKHVIYQHTDRLGRHPWLQETTGEVPSNAAGAKGSYVRVQVS